MISQGNLDEILREINQSERIRELNQGGIRVEFYSSEDDRRVATIEMDKNSEDFNIIKINLAKLPVYIEKGAEKGVNARTIVNTIVDHEANHIKLDKLYRNNLIEEFKRIDVEFDLENYSLYYRGRKVIDNAKPLVENEVLRAVFLDMLWWVASYKVLGDRGYNSELLTNYLTAINNYSGVLNTEGISIEVNKEKLKDEEPRTLKILHLLGLLAYMRFGDRYKNNPIELYPSIIELIEKENIDSLESLIMKTIS